METPSFEIEETQFFASLFRNSSKSPRVSRVQAGPGQAEKCDCREEPAASSGEETSGASKAEQDVARKPSEKEHQRCSRQPSEAQDECNEETKDQVALSAFSRPSSDSNQELRPEK